MAQLILVWMDPIYPNSIHDAAVIMYSGDELPEASPPEDLER